MPRTKSDIASQFEVAEAFRLVGNKLKMAPYDIDNLLGTPYETTYDRYTEDHLSILKSLTGPHGYAIYMAIKIRKGI